jgi:hypothetical protein
MKNKENIKSEEETKKDILEKINKLTQNSAELFIKEYNDSNFQNKVQDIEIHGKIGIDSFTVVFMGNMVKREKENGRDGKKNKKKAKR